MSAAPSTVAEWPVIATDPEWEMRQGPTLASETLRIELTWCTDKGFTASITSDGVQAIALTFENALDLASLSSALVDAWLGAL